MTAGEQAAALFLYKDLNFHGFKDEWIIDIVNTIKRFKFSEDSSEYSLKIKDREYRNRRMKGARINSKIKKETINNSYAKKEVKDRRKLGDKLRNKLKNKRLVNNKVRI